MDFCFVNDSSRENVILSGFTQKEKNFNFYNDITRLKKHFYLPQLRDTQILAQSNEKESNSIQINKNVFKIINLSNSIPKNERNYFLISALASKSELDKKEGSLLGI